MSAFTRKLIHTAVYWGSPVADGYGGQSFADPVELAVRWEDLQEVFTNQNGDEQVSKAFVMLAQAVDLNGFLYLGSLTDLSSADEGDPQIVDDAHLLESVGQVANVKGSETVFEVMR